MKYGKEHFFTDLAKTERGQILLNKYVPNWRSYANVFYSPISMYGSHYRADGITAEAMDNLLSEMNGPIERVIPEVSARKSLDEIDMARFAPGPGPLQGPAERISLEPVLNASSLPAREALSLDGEWLLAGVDGQGAPLWSEAVSAPVPGSVHTALVHAGRLPDTTFGRNQEIGREASYKDWWYKKRFTAPSFGGRISLIFEGVANKCEIFLNGAALGEHEGMFGGPEFDVTGLLKPENELMVHLWAVEQELDEAPHNAMGGDKFNAPNNHSWKKTVVSNNVYGWHYSCMPSLGIWNSVRLEEQPAVQLDHPFIATLDHESATLRLAVSCKSEGDWSGVLSGVIEPANFEGRAYRFEKAVSAQGDAKLLLEFDLPEAKLWWPNGLGEQNLYALRLSIAPKGRTGEEIRTHFGVRTVRMAPLADGPREDTFNWRFIVNGKSSFIKGTGWCTMDAMLDFSDDRYDRFLKLAHIQNCQMIRAWGAGMPEKDVFYDLCDQYGIMVMQEWPTAWDSHLTQPYEMLKDTVVRNTLRIRNHPSLILYCPGNESGNPFGEAIDMMGRLSVELDGTRAFHRGEPWGGSIHNYDSYWGRQSLDVHVNLEGDFFGEFGIACTPCAESVNRYLPDEEKNQWPARADGAFEYHTPIFGTAADLSRLSQMVGYFASADCDFETMTIASQLSQILGVRHTLERARIRYPYCGGALYYKLNDNFPAMSWATVDWYGAPKLGHYVFQKSFAPTAAFVLPTTLNFTGTEHSLPVYLADDLGGTQDRYEARLIAYDGRLRRLMDKRLSFEGDASIPDKIGTLNFSYEMLRDPLLLIFVELSKNGEKVFDTFYFFNYEAQKGCLFSLPKGNLSARAQDGRVTVKNTGKLPLAGVTIERAGHADTFTAWENFFWLEPGAEKTVAVDSVEGLSVRALNAERVTI